MFYLRLFYLSYIVLFVYIVCICTLVAIVVFLDSRPTTQPTSCKIYNKRLTYLLM